MFVTVSRLTQHAAAGESDVGPAGRHDAAGHPASGSRNRSSGKNVFMSVYADSWGKCSCEMPSVRMGVPAGTERKLQSPWGALPSKGTS